MEMICLNLQPSIFYAYKKKLKNTALKIRVILTMNGFVCKTTLILRELN